MKPKYSAFRKLALPTLIVLPAIAPIAYAATISPDSSGNVSVVSGTNAAATVLASGGTSVTPTVTIEPNATLTGDGVLKNAVRVTAPGYAINNSGILSGENDSIFFDVNGGTINNFGTINGITGLNSDGIDGLKGMTIVNNGTISGNATGINAGDALQLTNNAGASINGSSGYGVDAGDDAVITNQFGSVISGQSGGIRTGTNAQISNAGFILGNQGDGITLGLDGQIFNSGTIQGITGIFAVDGSHVVNSGIIRSTVLGGDAFLAQGGEPSDEVLVGLLNDVIGNNHLVLNLGSQIEGNVVGAGTADTITFNGGLTSPSGLSNVIRGDVTGFGSITKEGTGVAFIGTVDDVDGGLLVETDSILINDGGLYINADIQGLTPDSLATITAEGTALGGTGFWDANIEVNSGGFSAGGIPINLDDSPSNSVGRLAVFGDVVHQPDTFIRLDIIPDTVINNGVNSDLIDQLGEENTFTVTGANLRISPTDANRVITAGTYTIVDSDTQIIGVDQFGTVGVQFNDNVIDHGDFFASGSGPDYLDSVLTNFFATPGLEDGNTNLVVDVDYSFGSLPGLSDNEASIGAALDTLALRAGTEELGLAEQDLIAALALSDLETVQDSLDALNPESNVDLAIGAINSNYRLHRMVQDRMALARSQPGSVTMTTPPPMMDAKGGMVQSAPIQQSWASRGSVWGAYSYDWQDFEDRDAIRNSDGETQAFTLGFDYRTSSSFIIGGLIDGSKSDFDLSAGSSDVDSLRFALYGSYGESLGFYSDFLAGYGTHDLDQSRSVGGIQGLAGSRSFSGDADSFQALLTAGFAMGNESVKHGPFIGLEYQNLDVDSFSSGGGPLVVGVNDYDIDSFRGLIGYRFNGEYGSFRPYASVAYAHEFEDDYNNATASIDGVDFDIDGPRLRSAFIVTAGSGFALNPNLMLDIGYRGEIRYESTGISSHGGTIGLTYSF